MKHLLLPLLLLFSFHVFAEEVRTFDLQHRSAEEMIPVLRPMLDTGGAISGTGYTLIIRSSEANMKQLEQLIQHLDRAPKMLLISVDQDADSSHSSRGASVSGIGPDRDTRIHLYSTQRQGDNAGGQTLQVLEGHWATIRAGQAIPQVYRQYRQTPGGTRIEQGVQYRNVDTGFEVRPRLQGDRVTLDIRPFRAAPSEHGGGAIEQQAIATTVSARLGEWIVLGGVAEQQNAEGQGLVYSTRQRDQLTHNVRIRVDLVKP